MIWFGLGLLVLLGALGAAVIRVASVHLAADRALQARKLDLEERAVAISEQKAKGTAVPVLIPPDLQCRITAWGDVGSQESERKIILDLYADVAPHFDSESRRWQEVRASLPKLPSDDDGLIEVPLS